MGKSKQPKIQRNKTTLVQLPLTTLGQETRWAYSTTPPSPHGAADLAKPHVTPMPGRHRSTVSDSQGCSGAGTRWNAVPANILEPERRSGRISLATGGTLTLKRSGKSRRTR